MGRDLGAQFRGPEGLADVVVGAQAVGGHSILLGHARGQEDDGPVEVRADLPHELKAVEPRHHDVAEHEVEAQRSIPGTAVGSAALTTSWPSRPRTRASASRIARSSSTASILAMLDLLKLSSEL